MSAPYYQDDSVTLHHGDSLEVLRTLPDQSVDCCVTSPPYFGLRDYGVDGTDWPSVEYAPMAGLPVVEIPAMTCPLGMEPDPAAFVGHLRLIFAEVRRILSDDGTLWLNIGDSYAPNWSSVRSKSGVGQDDADRGRARRIDGIPPKNLLLIPARTALALQDDGWILRNDIIWAKPNAMPESVTDRLSTRHEHVFMLSKSRRYWFDLDPIREQAATADRTGPRRSYAPGSASSMSAAGEHLAMTGPFAGLPLNENGRNPGDVWSIPTQPFPGAHFAVMPPELARRAIVAGCKPGGVVLDPFSGSGTTGLVAGQNGRRYVGIDLSRDYLDLSLRTRLAQAALIDTEAAS